MKEALWDRLKLILTLACITIALSERFYKFIIVHCPNNYDLTNTVGGLEMKVINTTVIIYAIKNGLNIEKVEEDIKIHGIITLKNNCFQSIFVWYAFLGVKKRSVWQEYGSRTEFWDTTNGRKFDSFAFLSYLPYNNSHHKQKFHFLVTGFL